MSALYNVHTQCVCTQIECESIYKSASFRSYTISFSHSSREFSQKHTILKFNLKK